MSEEEGGRMGGRGAEVWLRSKNLVGEGWERIGAW